MASPETLPELANQATSKYLQLGTSSALERINPDDSVGQVQMASFQGRNALGYQGKIEQNKAITDRTQLLTQMSNWATHFSINLNDQVDRNMNIPPHRDSSAIVFQGTLRSDGTRLTVKTVRAGLPVENQQTIEEVVREMHIWSGLHHENITPLLGIITTFDHTVTFVSKWIEPKNALEYVQYDEVDPRPLLLGIAEGLNYLHKYKSGPLCHGDLRGVNVMVSEDGQALLSFGITTLVHALFQPGANLESPGRAPNWVSPEELESGVFVKTPEADVWAFGMIALELFTHKPPFGGIESVADVKSRIMRGPPDHPSDEETSDRLTDGWWDLCLQCWQREPSSRPGIQAITSEIKKLMNTPELPDNATEELATMDVVVAIMGPTGSGKSSFISQFTGNKHGVGHSLTSCTSTIQVTRCMIGASSVVLVDTPGFDDTNKSDLQILEMVSQWLEKTYEKKVFLSSILFFHRITDNRMAGTPLKNLRVFQKLCGKKAMGRVVLVTTMWDEIEEQIGKKRLEELKQSYWKAMIGKGSKTYEYKNDQASAKKLLETIVQDKTQRESVALQKEIADLKMELRQTGAGQELCSSLEQLAERRLEVLQKIRAEREAATDEETSRDLRKEYEELRTQLNATLNQVQNLKLSLRQRAVAHLAKFKARKGPAQMSVTHPPEPFVEVGTPRSSNSTEHLGGKTTSETSGVPNEPPTSRPGTPVNWRRLRPSWRGLGRGK